MGLSLVAAGSPAANEHLTTAGVIEKMTRRTKHKAQRGTTEPRTCTGQATNYSDYCSPLIALGLLSLSLSFHLSFHLHTLFPSLFLASHTAVLFVVLLPFTVT